MATLKDSANTVLISKQTLKKENYVLLQETFTLTSNTSKSYNVATLLGADATKYNLATIEAEVYCKDTEVGSVTNGYYVRADAVFAIGFKTTGEVLIRNLYTSSLDCLVRLRVTKKADS